MAPGLPNRSVILCILKWNQQGTLRALEGRWGLRALENCRYCPSGHKGWYPWLSGARCVSVLGLFFPGKSLPSFVYRVSPHSLVWRCLFFLIFEELSKGEHRYRSQPDRLCVVVSPPPPMDSEDLWLTANAVTERFRNEGSKNQRVIGFSGRLINCYSF